jgi:hypothetical protein
MKGRLPQAGLNLRLLVVISIAVLLGASSWGVSAYAMEQDAFETDSDDLGRYRASIGRGPVMDAASSALVPRGGVSNLIWVAQPIWSAGDPGMNGGLCRSWRYVAAGNPDEASVLQEQGRDAYLAIHSMLLSFEAPDVAVDIDCPGDTGAQVPLVVLRDAVRTAVTGLLPRPELYIAPGFALAGLETYLDTGWQHVLKHSRVEALTVGPFTYYVEIEASGETIVDWGDGSPPVTYTVPGRPYPEGEIRHTYMDAATVTVTVTDRWRIDFRATTAGGAVLTDSVDAELEQVLIEDLEVREFRAVRASR